MIHYRTQGVTLVSDCKGLSGQGVKLVCVCKGLMTHYRINGFVSIKGY